MALPKPPPPPSAVGPSLGTEPPAPIMAGVPPAPAAAAPAPAPAAPAPAPVAAAQAPAVPAAPTAGALSTPRPGSLEAAAAEQGFGQLNFNAFGVFPIVKLADGMFVDSNNRELGDRFVCQLLQHRPKYLYTNGVAWGKPGAEAVYSYDGQTDSNNGAPLSDTLERWSQEGHTSTMKTYAEVAAVLDSDQSRVLLSVAPSSVSRLATYISNMLSAGKRISELKTLVYQGERVTSVATPFVPWDFHDCTDQV